MPNIPVVVLDGTLTNIANAIRGKNGSQDTYKPSEMPAAITAIPSGGGDGIPREVDANGVYGMPTQSFTFSLPANAANMASSALYYAFSNCTALTSVDLSSLTTVSGTSALNNAFSNCTALTSVDLSSLATVVNGTYALSRAFEGCTALTSVDFSSLTTVSGASALSNAFSNCTRLTSLSFPALTASSFGSYTNQFDRMLFGCSNVTVHFPAAIQSTIGSWSSVTSGFGGTNTTVLFDL